MTQEQLATLVGVSRQSVAKWESERSYPEMDKLIKMTGIFGCTLDELVMGRPSDSEKAQDDALPAEEKILGNEEENGDEVGESSFRKCSTVHSKSTEKKAGETEAMRASGSASTANAAETAASSAMGTPASSAIDPHGYDAHMRSFAKRIAWGVALIIAGVALMLFAEAAIVAVTGIQSENSVVLLALLAGLGAGLGLIIPTATGHATFMREHLVIRDFYTTEDRNAAGRSLTRGIIIGIALIFLGIVVADYGMGSFAITVVGLVSLGMESGPAFLVADHIAVGLFVLCVAAAVWSFIYCGIMYSRVQVRAYNRETLEELTSVDEDGPSDPAALVSQLSPEERRLLFDSEGIDGNDSSQVRSYFEAKREHNKLTSGISGIIMIVATIIGLCLMFGIPTFSPYFWMAWVIGGLCCALAKIIVNMLHK